MTSPVGGMVRLVRFAVLALFVVGLSTPALAGPNDIVTREWIVNRAEQGVGYGYWWGHGRWRDAGTPDGHCTGSCGGCQYWSGPPHMDHDPANETQCTTFNQAGCYGADCSGFVSKCWDVGSSTDLDYDEHPYSTGSFRYSTTHWHRINRSELRRGDALVYNDGSHGHIVLYDRPGSNGNYWVWEARGCAYGIIHRERSVGAAYIAIRRNNLEEAPPCTPDACNGHGEQVNGDCVCEAGYAGETCDQCAKGYTGYPDCHATWETCRPTDTIECGQTVGGNTSGGNAEMTDYAPYCGNWSLEGDETVYEFKPTLSGKASLRLSNMEHDQDLMILSQRCHNLACTEYGNNEAFFEYEADGTYYIAVDNWAGDEGSFSLTLECDEFNPHWIGDVCGSGDDTCDFSHPDNPALTGRCWEHSDSETKFCSMDCNRYCPDMENKAPTYCVEDPDNRGHGMCVSQADSDHNDCCGTITGTTAQYMNRFNDPRNSAWVCMPEPETDE